MSTKLNSMILDKILHQNVSKTFLQNVKYLQVTYNHNERSFNLNIKSKNNNQNETRNEAKLDNATENKMISHSFKMDRNQFIKEVLSNFECINQQPNKKPKNVVIDFSSPNIAKPFHAGHLRSTIIGNFIANINIFFSNNVHKINYLGDWGTQFGILQYGLDSKKIDLNNLVKNPMRKLYDIYVEANKIASGDENIQKETRKYFAHIEKGQTSLDNWRRIREITVEEVEKVYKRLGIVFDAYHWESDYNGNAIKDIITLLDKNKIIVTSDEGKKVAKFKGKDITVLKSDNTTLYLTRDIAALLDRYEKYNFDKMLYVVDNSQTDHFAALFDIVRQVNKECADSCQHIKFGRVKGMSTRNGNVVFLNDILDEAKYKMKQQQEASKNTRYSAMNEETCDILGATAVIINDLKQKRQKDYVFDWDRALQSEGDSGIKLQYLHCRLLSLEQNCNVKIPTVCLPEYLEEEVVGDVIAELAKFEDVLHRALDEKEACILVNYLFRLARHVNKMFNELNVKNASDDVAAQRLLVFHTARKIVRTGLEILGIKPLNEM